MEITVKDINVTITEATSEILDKLYKNWSLTLEGLDPNSIKDWVEVLADDISKEAKVVIYTISGKLMNEKYHLTGKNAYPNDTTIVAFETNSIFINEGKVAIQRFSYGGRWFTDIVDNNARREASH